MMSSTIKPNAILLGLAVMWTGACEPGEVPLVPTPSTSEVGGLDPVIKSKHYLLPEAMRVDHASVNVFVERAMDVVVSGAYEPFRLLWVVEDEPVSKLDFERDWAGLSDVRVRALRRIILTDAVGTPTGVDTYALLVDFFPDSSSVSGRREPLRDVVWLVVQEKDHWRLAKPPKAAKRWLREETGKGT